MRSALADLKPYLVDQDASGVKLNQNESPYDLPARLKKKIADALAREPWNRYPAHPPVRLIEAVARLTGHPKEGVVVGNSSNEIILARPPRLSASREGAWSWYLRASRSIPGSPAFWAFR